MICFMTLGRTYSFSVLLPFSTEAVGVRISLDFIAMMSAMVALLYWQPVQDSQVIPRPHQTLFKALGSFFTVCAKRLKGTLRRISQPEIECPEITLLQGIWSLGFLAYAAILVTFWIASLVKESGNKTFSANRNAEMVFSSILQQDDERYGVCNIFIKTWNEKQRTHICPQR